MPALAKEPPTLYLIATCAQGGKDGACLEKICGAIREIASPERLSLLVQLRDKEASAAQLTATSIAWRKTLRAHRGFLILNERIDVAITTGAVGVQLGKECIPIAEARRLLPEGLIGWSAHSPAEALDASAQGADFVTLSPIWSSPGKGEPLGAQALEAARTCPVPLLALGGLGAKQIPEARAAGASGAALIRAVFDADDPARAARQLASALVEE